MGATMKTHSKDTPTPTPISVATNAYELLGDVAEAILREPKRFDFGNWLEHIPAEHGGPACGTVGCIAGWAVVLTGDIPASIWTYSHRIATMGAILLGTDSVTGMAPYAVLPHDVDSESWRKEVTELFVTALRAPAGLVGSFEYAARYAVRIYDFREKHRARLLSTAIESFDTRIAKLMEFEQRIRAYRDQ
jgi:hypothetical protein